MKVIHCFRSPVGGLFRHVSDLVQLQSKQGIQTGIICDTLTGGAQADKVLGDLARVCELGVYRLPITRLPAIADYSTLKKAGEICRKISPDIIHGHGAKGGAYSRLLGHKFGARTVYTPHGGTLHFDAWSLSGMAYFALERILGRSTDAIIFESQFSAKAYEKKVGQMRFFYKVIHNGLSDTELSASGHIEGEYDFLFLGEFRNLKGLDVFLTAIAMIKSERPIRVLIAGAGHQSRALTDQIEALGLKDLADLSAPIFPATEAFRKTKCLVVPSRAESLPYTILEAAAAGVPLIATKVGGIGEIFGPYSDVLIEPNNANALADSMRRTMGHPAATKANAEKLSKRIRSSFRLDKMGRDIDSLYSDVIGTATP